MIKFYYSLAPNPMKVALFLEEAGLPYEALPVEAMKGEQFSPGYLAINPNGKLPSIVDGAAVVFDSSAILLYLAEKTGKFLPDDTLAARGQLLSWLMFVASGVGPFSGQAVHFKHYAPQPIPYAQERYRFEAARHYKVVDGVLAKSPYMLGSKYTIVDMSLWGWARAVPFVLGENAWEQFPHLKRLIDEISARPAAVRANALREKHTFKSTMDEEARRFLFPHLSAQVS